MVVLGVTVIVAPVCPPGDHVKFPPGELAFAVSVAICPAQTVALLTVKVGSGLMVTVTGVNADGQPGFVHVIITCPLPF